MQYLGIFVESLPDSMSAEFAYDRKAAVLGVALYHMADVTQMSSWLHLEIPSHIHS